MCNPDLTLEVKDERLGGVKGFGTQHVCSDFSQLKSWTKQWESYGQDPARQELASASHDHKHEHTK